MATIAEQLARSNLVNQKRQKPCYIIDPRTSARLGFWDALASVALIFTAVVTPVEVGFLRMPEDRWADALFITNRCIDMIFICDMFMQFIIMYPKYAHSDNAHIGGGTWIYNLRSIAMHNITGPWFYVDAFSISVSAFDVISPADSGASRLKVFRAVRVLRLLKLVRLARGSRMFKR